jgi:Lrp/AsnC family transcriptional regulator, regulator for asnA, asnC and gidA
MLDDIERRILARLQKNAGEPQKVIADDIGITEPTLSKRIKKLREDGILKRYTVDLDFGKAGYALSAFSFIREKKQSKADTEVLSQFLLGVPEAIQVYKFAGDWDFFVIWMCRDTDHLDDVLETVHSHPNVEKTETEILMRALKRETGVPL